MKNNPAIGRMWKEARKELFSPEEIRKSNHRVAAIQQELADRQRIKGSSSEVAIPYNAPKCTPAL